MNSPLPREKTRPNILTNKALQLKKFSSRTPFTTHLSPGMPEPDSRSQISHHHLLVIFGVTCCRRGDEESESYRDEREDIDETTPNEETSGIVGRQSRQFAPRYEIRSVRHHQSYHDLHLEMKRSPVPRLVTAMSIPAEMAPPVRPTDKTSTAIHLDLGMLVVH